jgi:hypothetical protein
LWRSNEKTVTSPKDPAAKHSGTAAEIKLNPL